MTPAETHPLYLGCMKIIISTQRQVKGIFVLINREKNKNKPDIPQSVFIMIPIYMYATQNQQRSFCFDSIDGVIASHRELLNLLY